MKMLFKILGFTLESLLFVTLATMTAVVASNVFCRFVLGFSLSWGDEFAQILMVWMTFLGAAVGMRDKAHYAFDYLVKSMPAGAKKFFVLFSELIAIVMSMVLLYYSAKVTFLIYAVKNFLETLTTKERIVIATEEEVVL